jgi:hypothetical protein
VLTGFHDETRHVIAGKYLLTWPQTTCCQGRATCQLERTIQLIPSIGGHPMLQELTREHETDLQREAAAWRLASLARNATAMPRGQDDLPQRLRRFAARLLVHTHEPVKGGAA